MSESEVIQALRSSPSTSSSSGSEPEPDSLSIGLIYNFSASAITDQNLKFSYPLASFVTSANIFLQQAPTQPNYMWIVLSAVSVEVYILFFGIGLLTGLLIWIFEETEWKAKAKTQHLMELLEVVLETFRSPFYTTNILGLKRFSSRITLWSFWLSLF